MIVAVWWAVLNRLDDYERDAVASAERNLGNLALAFDEGLSRSIKAIDLAILAVRAEYHDRGLSPDLKNLIELLGRAEPMIASIGLADANGDVIFATNPGPNAPARFNIADRPHFQAHLEPGPDRLYISPPLLARLAGK